MNVVSQLIKDIPVPNMAEIIQHFPRPAIPVKELSAAIETEINAKNLTERIRPGMKICITAGSRGICNSASIIQTIVLLCKKQGAHPFVIPAMGSHGGATAEGQLEVLHGLGITEDFIGCPIRSSMETVAVGKTECGQNVHMDKFAAQADGIILAGRVKPHTGFRGTWESGLMKMAAIGLGKQHGADSCHRDGFGALADTVPAFARVILQKAPVLFGLACIENAYDETYRLAALAAEDIEREEPDLLKDAFAHMPRILLPECDVLVIDEIGKNFSGDGADPNITGTFFTPFASGGVKTQRTAILGISEHSHGNGYGVGMADVTTRRFFNQIDLNKTYPNAVTSKLLNSCRIPIIVENDREAIQLCIKTCTGIDFDNPRIIRIPNSLHLDRIRISQALVPQAKTIADIEFASEAAPVPFSAEGNLF